jgi:hypothetical protein
MISIAACSSNETQSSRAPVKRDAALDAPSNTAPGDASVVSHVSLPAAAPGIGFDDLEFAPHLGKILAPAGRTGTLDLVDVTTEEITAIPGFSTTDQYAGGHDFGTTSAVEGPHSLVLATDRTTVQLHVVDPALKKIVGSTSVASPPDYVRWVETTSEAWVTEPDAGQIEIFSASADNPPTLTHAATIAVTGGPESLVIDATRARAYTNSFVGSTFSIDLNSRSIVETWSNGCKLSLGLALDEARGFAFVGCPEGKAVTLDVAHGGTTVSSVATGGGVDIVAFSSTTGHVYVPAPTPKTLAILGVSDSGALTTLGVVDGAGASVAADDRHQAWVADPTNGALIRVHDGYR